MIPDATLTATLDVGFGKCRTAAIKVDAPYIEAFAPVDVCTDSLMAAIVPRGVTETSVRVVRKRRHDYAKVLAEALTGQIVKIMEQEDTRDGY